MTERPRKSIPQPKPPERDEHGCLIGVEVYDAKKGKCVPIVKPAGIGTEPLQERDWVAESQREWEKGRYPSHVQ